jgi:hypothetical protein
VVQLGAGGDRRPRRCALRCLADDVGVHLVVGEVELFLAALDLVEAAGRR